MYLPPHICRCIQILEQAGFPSYAVGGCVRDALLGLTPHDYDLCTAAPPDVIKTLFRDFSLVLAGEKHGTVGVITQEGVVEITAFRTEGAYQDHRHPDRVCFVDSIEQDLARRDFTVNAMAFSPTRGFADPFGGRQDLQERILRAVGDPATRFREDALRILRGVRFSVRFGLQPECKTLDAMHRLAPLIAHLARERVWEELCRLLPCIHAHELLRFAPVITQVIPELASCIGFDQRSRHHAYDVFGHTAHVVELVPPELPLRLAALLHDVAKPTTFSLDDRGNGHFFGHAERSAEMAEEILRRLKAPTQLREQVVCLVKLHMTPIEPQPKAVRRWLSRLGEATFLQLLILQESDSLGKGTGEQKTDTFERLQALLLQIKEENSCLSLRDLALNGHDLMALGYAGPQIGKALQMLLELVLDEKVPNEKNALKTALLEWKL